jgi:hypothetical protein
MPTLASTPELVWGMYTPVDQYAERILARSRLRGWGFDGGAGDPIMKLAFRSNANLWEHWGILKPVGAMLWLGHDLAYNWAEGLAWLKDELEAADTGLKWNNYLKDAVISFYPGSEQSGKPNAGAVGLDLSAFWVPRDSLLASGGGLVPSERRRQKMQIGYRWPALEVLWFLALNPQYCGFMNGKTEPFLMAAGLEVSPGFVPVFTRHGRDFFVGAESADARVDRTSMVSFRDR